MIGKVSVRIMDNRNSYFFELNRNITVLTGESGRGKTTLFEMIEDYNRNGSASGVKLICDHQVIAIGDRNWQEEISEHENSVMVIDEDNKFIRTHEFADAVKKSSNYFLLITRSYLEQLPYSVTEIYEISGTKNKKFKNVYSGTDYIYKVSPVTPLYFSLNMPK